MTLPPRDNLRGAGWLLADLALNVWALAIVKALGLGYPPAQLVFLRATVGLAMISPLIWHQRSAFRGIPSPARQALRVVLSAITLVASYYALARVPLALVSAMNFTRPLVVMLLAALVLREGITRAQWGAAALALVGALIAVGPVGPGTQLAGVMALLIVVLAGSGAVIVTRALRATPDVVLMTTYAAGLALCTAPVALLTWQPVDPGHMPALLAIGAFAQGAQLCFLRAHFHGEAGVLSVLGYLGLPLSVLVGWLAFDEWPTPRFFAGATLVLAAGAYVGWRTRRKM